LLFSGLSTAALAHASLVSGAPAANSVAKPPPTELRLKFSEAIEVKFAHAKVIGPDKMEIETGSPKLDPDNKTAFIVPLTTPLADGKYTVEWLAVSVDGHKTRGSYGFDVMR
jgi:methionine-rich copper-binding protein CopC